MILSLSGAEVREGPIRILFVCTGNICRSPLAEALLRHKLSDLPVVVASAGTHALAGQGMTEQNQRIASANGVNDVRGHLARQITREIIRDSDLVLSLSREHRRHIVGMSPRSSRYTFTLREFGRLAEAYTNYSDWPLDGTKTSDKLRNIIKNVVTLRGTLPLLENPDQDDVVDPYGMNDAVYAQSFAQLEPAISNIANVLLQSITGEVNRETSS